MRKKKKFKLLKIIKIKDSSQSNSVVEVLKTNKCFTRFYGEKVWKKSLKSKRKPMTVMSPRWQTASHNLLCLNIKSVSGGKSM